MIDLTHIRACSFDCYGTLIDWQTGILAALRPRLAARGVAMDDEAILRRYAQLEAAAEEPPYRPYRQVLETVAAGFFGPSATPDERECLWRSLGSWPAFADTPGALARLQKRVKIIIASNIDNDLFALSKPKLGIEPDEVVTAQQVRSYKPGRAHFDEVLRRAGLRAEQVLHVAESRRHDIEPARRLGFPTAWINRTGSGPSASGVPTDSSLTPDLTAPTLAALADTLGL